MARMKTKEEVVEEFIVVHGDEYDYSLMDYKGNKNKVKIICKKHGIFTKTPSNHKKGQGCQICSNEIKNKSMMKPKEKVLNEFKEVHGDNYDYSLMDYQGTNKKVKIRCKKHDHIFPQTPEVHIRGSGCPKCGDIQTGKKLTKSQEDILNEFEEFHGDYFDYSNFIYVNGQTEGEIICPIHNSFFQTPDSHFRTKFGCPKCSKEKRNTRKLSQETVISQFKDKIITKHNGKLYGLDKVVYVDDITKVLIKCPESNHDYFDISPTNFKQGFGCPKCSKSGFNRLKAGILYYIRIEKDGIVVYKIGITNLSVKKRYSNKDLDSITVVKEWYYDSGQECYEQEQKIIKEFSFAKYNGIDLLERAKTKEMFKHDILDLDTSFIKVA